MCIRDRDMVDRLIKVTQQITGGLDAPNRGVLFVLPVARAIGLNYNAD